MAMIPLIAFFHPERLWFVLAVPLLLLVYFALIRRRQVRAATTGISNLSRLLPGQAAWKRHIAVIAAVGSLASLVVAFAQPKDLVNVPRERATIVVAIDVSRSMAAEDVKPNRMAAAQDAAQRFVNVLPEGFNVSLVAFAGASSIIVPPTIDRGMVNRAIDNLQLAPATAIGEGIYSSLDALTLAPLDPKHPDEPAPGSIVILSDGYSNVGRASDDAAKIAKERGYAIYTIAYGTLNGYVEVDGQREPVPYRPEELAQVARLSGGESFKAGSSDELSRVYQSIARSVGYEKVEKEVTERYVGGALGLAVIASLAVLSLAARWP